MRDLPNASYYRATANDRATYGALTDDRRADLVVIGGGFTGVSAALAAAERGLSVALIEARDIGFGASGRNGGQLIPGMRWSARELVDTYGEDRGGAIVRLALSAVDRVADRIARHNIACDHRWGHVEAAWKPKHFHSMLAEAEYLNAKFGWSSQHAILAQDMPAHVATDRYCGGVIDKRGGHFHPLNYLLGLCAAAEAAAVAIFEHSPVTSLVQDDGGVNVRTSTGSIRADRAIIAADSWTSDVLPALRPYTIPIINYNIATAPLPDPAALIPGNSAIADSRFVLNYYRLSADGRLIFGGGEKYRQTPPRDIAAFVRPYMTQLFPQLCDIPIDYAWGGAVSVSMNRLPHIGRQGRILFAHGFSGHGALLTTLAGEVMAQAALAPCADFELLSAMAHKPFPGGAWLARPLATLGLLWYALRDRL